MINGEEYAQFRDPMVLPSTVGFFIPKPGGFRSAGTGTFVNFGETRGVLTCAHVIDEIAREPRVDLAIFPVREAQRFIPLNVRDYCDYVKIGPSRTQQGPDIAFLKLPIPFFDSISHLVSAKNMNLGRKHAFAEAEPNEFSVTSVTGMIAEWTPGVQTTVPFTVCGLVSIGEIAERMKSGEHDFFRFRPLPDQGFRTPSSYAGTSGGGLWRYYPKRDDGGDGAYRLVGVAFYETEDGQIICHGQASLYVRLFDAVRAKWPEASPADVQV